MKNNKAERELSLDFLRVTEAAAIESAKTMGQGDRKHSDQVAVEAMREVMDSVPMRGRIVIGEGERDEAPMLYIGEEVGGGFGVGEEIPSLVLKWILRSTRSRVPTFAHSALTMRLQCWQRRNVAACLMRQTFTWTRL